MLAGQFVGTIGGKAGELATQLNKAEGRYRTASSELKQWLDALEPAQSRTLTLLTNAQQARDTLAVKGASVEVSPIKLNVPHPSAPEPSAPAGGPPPPWDDPAITEAHSTLAAARHEAAQIAADLDTQAARHERNIKAASQHDGLKDSRWDRLKAAAHSGFGRLLSDVCNGLGWIATGLAIAALFFPGVDLLVLGAFAATALSLGGHSLLAATGAGSFFDVGMDVIGLASFGVGSVIGRGTEAAVTGLKSTLAGGEAAVDGAKGLVSLAKNGEAVTKLASASKPENIATMAKESSEVDDIYEGVASKAAQRTKNIGESFAQDDFDFEHCRLPAADLRRHLGRWPSSSRDAVLDQRDHLGTR